MCLNVTEAVLVCAILALFKTWIVLLQYVSILGYKTAGEYGHGSVSEKECTLVAPLHTQ